MDYRPQKDDPNRIRNMAMGNLITYYGELSVIVEADEAWRSVDNQYVKNPQRWQNGQVQADKLKIRYANLLANYNFGGMIMEAPSRFKFTLVKSFGLIFEEGGLIRLSRLLDNLSKLQDNDLLKLEDRMIKVYRREERDKEEYDREMTQYRLAKEAKKCHDYLSNQRETCRSREVEAFFARFRNATEASESY
jgi:hypothetical protein